MDEVQFYEEGAMSASSTKSNLQKGTKVFFGMNVSRRERTIVISLITIISILAVISGYLFMLNYRQGAGDERIKRYLEVDQRQVRTNGVGDNNEI